MHGVTQSFSVTYGATPAAVPQARADLGGFAREAGATAHQVDDVRLAVSEAMTNAVLHAYRGGPGTIHVTGALAGRELWILIADEGAGMQAEAERPGLGLGLGLISQMSDELAIVPRSTGGVEVRLRFRIGADCGSPGADPLVWGDDTSSGALGALASARNCPARD